MCHFGELDKSIPINLVKDFKNFMRMLRYTLIPLIMDLTVIIEYSTMQSVQKLHSIEV